MTEMMKHCLDILTTVFNIGRSNQAENIFSPVGFFPNLCNYNNLKCHMKFHSHCLTLNELLASVGLEEHQSPHRFTALCKASHFLFDLEHHDDYRLYSIIIPAFFFPVHG